MNTLIESVQQNINLNGVTQDFSKEQHTNKKTTIVENVFKESVGKKRPLEISKDISESAPLTLKRITSAHDSLIPIPSQSDDDIRMIKMALGGTEVSHVEKFEKQYGQTMEAIVEAMVQELTEVRQSKLGSIGFGGFKISGIKKWKFLVKLNYDGNITELVIGKFKAEGGFTKVYFTMDKRVILVPKKSQSDANRQLLHAYESIYFLYRQYLIKDKEELDRVIDILPSLPKINMIGERPILEVPQALSNAQEMFKSTPKSWGGVLKRLEILRDVAKCLSICHAHGLTHLDIKPDNMLISQNQRGHLHDFGVSRIFCSEDSPEEAIKKYEEVVTTSTYMHFQDLKQRHNLIAKRGSVELFTELAKASDVFSLGVSTAEALMGMNDVNGDDQYAFDDTALYNYEGQWFLNGPVASLRNEISYLKKVPSTHKKLELLLDRALDSNYKDRISADDFYRLLDSIIIELKTIIELNRKRKSARSAIPAGL